MVVEVSIVVPTYNRANTLKRTISSLLKIDYPKNKYEIIIVDDGSTDNTKKVVKSFGDKRIIYIYQKNKGPAAARNNGIKKSKGKYIFFTDDDCIIPKNWIKEYLKRLKAKSVVAVGGPMKMHPKVRKNTIAQYIEKNNKFPKKELSGGMEVVWVGSTANIVYKKSILKKVGGFNTNFKIAGGEDADLKYRLVKKGYKFVYVPLPVLHYHRINIRSFINMKKNRGIGHMIFTKIHNRNIEIGFFLNLLNFSPFIIFLALIYFIKGIKKYKKIKFAMLYIMEKYAFFVGELMGVISHN